MSEDLEFMIRRFPLHRDKILNEYNTNDEFKTLCEDFYTCAQILHHQKKANIENKKNELEFQELFLDLEHELVHCLGITKSF